MSTREPADWLRLFAPLPAGARPRRSPVAPPGSAGAAPDSPIAGWTSLVLDLTDMPFGTRVVHVVLDAEGTPIAASDHVLFRTVGEAAAAPVQMRQESVGGRIEADGSFRGTHWIVEGPEPEGDEEPAWTSSPRQPTEEEQLEILALARDVLSRAQQNP